MATLGISIRGPGVVLVMLSLTGIYTVLSFNASHGRQRSAFASRSADGAGT